MNYKNLCPIFCFILMLLVIITLNTGAADYAEFVKGRNIEEVFLSHNGSSLVVIEEDGNELIFYFWQLDKEDIKQKEFILKQRVSGKKYDGWYKKGNNIVFSPDGTLLALRKDNNILVYSLNENKLLHKISLVEDDNYRYVYSLAISPDNSELICYQYLIDKQIGYIGETSTDYHYKVANTFITRWSLKNGKKLFYDMLKLPTSSQNVNDIKDSPDPFTHISYSHNGNYLVFSGLLDRGLLAKKNMSIEDNINISKFFTIKFIPDKNGVLYQNSDEEYEIYDLDKSKLIGKIEKLKLHQFAAGSNNLIANISDGKFEEYLLDGDDNLKAKMMKKEDLRDNVYDIAYNCDWSQWIIAGEKSIYRFSVTTKEEIRAIKLFNEGKELYEIGFYEEAVNNFKNAITLAPLKVDDIRHINSFLLTDEEAPLLYSGQVYLHYYQTLLKQEKKAKLGLSIKEKNQKIVVDNTFSNTPIYEAGIREGDIITAVDGKKYKEPKSLANYLANKSPGDEVVVSIIKSGIEKEVKVKMVEGFVNYLDYCWAVYRLIEYGTLAVNAGYPALARKAVLEMEGFIDNYPADIKKRNFVTDGITIVESLVAAREKGSQAAYKYMLKRHKKSKLEFHRFYITTYPKYFASLYEDREKLAYFLSKEVSELPLVEAKIFKKQKFVDFNGNVIDPDTSVPKLTEDNNLNSSSNSPDSTNKENDGENQVKSGTVLD